MSADHVELGIEPREEIEFKGPFTSKSDSNLNLTNPSADKWVVYKVMTTDPRRYIVHPNYGVIAPATCTVVNLQIRPLPDEAAIKAFLETKQKFLVQWRTLAASPEEDEEAHSLFIKAVSKVSSCKIGCRFAEPISESSQAQVEKQATPQAEKQATPKAEKPAEAQVEKPAEAQVEKPAKTLVEKPTETQVEKPAETRVEKPSGTQVEKPAGTQVEKPAGTPIEKLVAVSSEGKESPAIKTIGADKPPPTEQPEANATQLVEPAEQEHVCLIVLVTLLVMALAIALMYYQRDPQRFWRRYAF